MLAVMCGIVLALILLAPPLHVRAPDGDSSAIRVLKTIYAAQIQYRSTFNRFATTLTQLGPPPVSGGTQGPGAAGLIPDSLASGESIGYVFTLTSTAQGYAVVAVPTTLGNTGRRTLYLDQSGVIRQNWGPEPAAAQTR